MQNIAHQLVGIQAIQKVFLKTSRGRDCRLNWRFAGNCKYGHSLQGFNAAGQLLPGTARIFDISNLKCLAQF